MKTESIRLTNKKWIWSKRKHPADLAFWTLINYYCGAKDCGRNWIFPIEVPESETFFGGIMIRKNKRR